MPDGRQDLLAYADQAQYVGVDDQLLIQSIASYTGSNYYITARLLRADGVIVPINYSYTQDGAYSLAQQQFQLAQGFLVGLEVMSDAQPGQGQWSYVKVDLTRGALLDVVQYQPLMAGYVSFNFAYGYPKQKYQRPTDGPGTVMHKALAPLEAGTDWAYFQPANSRSKVLGILATLTTSAAVAVRLVTIEVQDVSGNPFLEIPANDTQIASLTTNYNISSAPIWAGSSVTSFLLPLPPNLVIGPQCLLLPVTANLDAGDEWGYVEMAYLEWADL